ncbi:hypothetical protein Glove_141g113 [Diversispora epigaea]|uniref:Uncharacterized protein n=1 Tax=Diversispora epigaea TaxID=1348612 RepID=A0A397J175_9GLOM|nr:hypothetical protein Glove_141g113 [Diversispora epigaea]
MSYLNYKNRVGYRGTALYEGKKNDEYEDDGEEGEEGDEGEDDDDEDDEDEEGEDEEYHNEIVKSESSDSSSGRGNKEEREAEVEEGRKAEAEEGREAEAEEEREEEAREYKEVCKGNVTENANKKIEINSNVMETNKIPEEGRKAEAEEGREAEAEEGREEEAREYEEVREGNVTENANKKIEINSNVMETNKIRAVLFDYILNLQSNEEPEVENIKEFPNEAYADLMALVIENNLNNKAGNAIIKFFNKHLDLSQLSPLPKNIETGRKFMDKMNISQLSYSKYCVLTHNSQDYFVHYHPIKNCIKTLLSNPDILKNLMFRYENLKIEDEKSYGEQNSGNWWKRAERSISNHANILSIILYSDATTTDTLGKSSLHPIYASGNFLKDAKQLLEYLPILSAKNEKEKKSSEFKELARETFHNSIKFLLDPLFQGDGVDFNIYDKDIWFFPRISTIICNWLEACTFSLTYKSANSNYPCHFCLVQREDLIDIRKKVILRNHVNMKEYFDSNTSKLAGLEQVNNYFWSIPNLNIYAATVPDRIHHLDLGLFKYQIEFIMELLKKKKSLNKVNERIADIPRHSQLKVFKKGIQLSRLTASEYRDIMKIMVFVVDDLQIEDLSEVYVKWNEMYLLSRSEKFKESDLENFQKAINNWGDLFIKLFQNISNSHLKFLKLHSWIYHIVDTIQEYGAINGYTTETYESLYKTYVKIPYRLSNKKEVEKQIMKNIRRCWPIYTFKEK